MARVQSLGMTELMESQLLHLAPLLTNICLANLQKLAIANKSSTVTITAISSLNNGSLSPYVLSPVIDGCHWRRTCNTDNSGPAGSDMCIGPADLPLGRASEAFAPGERPVTSTLNLITKTTSGALGGAAAHSPAQLARIRVIHLPRNEAVSLALSTFILNPSCNEEAFCNGGSELCSSGDVEMPAKIPLLGGPDGGLKRDTKLGVLVFKMSFYT
ncbi:unnamed protein product [Protopolystoma xenopodis]|uniref:Uncharacterized protein n=1 Tax=Protopolystoma xenopodis TaxID=117903 RepID=A0A3S5AMI7_9PLAT|nr:unnamed protein product [Protopolystoma xenopodis]